MNATTIKTAKKETVKVSTNVSDLTNNVKSIENEFTFLSNKPAKVVTKSELTIQRMVVTDSMESNVKSVSTYFNEMRKNHKEIAVWLKTANSKGRTFDGEVIHDVLMNGNIKPVLKASDIIEGAKVAKNPKYVTPKFWSANRLFAAFVNAVETTVKK
jgi:hypothetical protein